jgi:hypothetical protein
VSNAVGYPQRFAQFWDMGVESCKLRWLYAHKAGDALRPGSGSAVTFAKRFGGC